MLHHAERLCVVVAGFVAVFAVAGSGSALAQPVQPTSPAPAEADREVFESTSFLSPDGNIACNIGMDEGVRCDIIDADWPRPAPPADCQESYGRMIAINPWIGLGEPAEFICAGDTVFGSDEPLQDGESITSGAFRCESVDSGITCRNTETSHGFSISHDAYQLF